MSKFSHKIGEVPRQDELLIDLKTPLSKIEPVDESSVIIGGDALMTEQNQGSWDGNMERGQGRALQQRPQT